MRERVLDAIYKKLDENPNDVDMQRQLVLINRANISTIHSFCLDVIKNNFYKIDISPNFRLAEGAEIEILKMEILDQVFDDLYEEENQEFLKLLNTYCSYRDDDKLKSIIQKIYKYIMSMPYPEKWLNSQIEKFNLKELKDFSTTEWGKILIESFKEELHISIETLLGTVSSLKREEELKKYELVILDDIDILTKIINCNTWDEIYENVNSIKFKTWPIDKKCSLALKDEAKEVRDRVKANISSATKLFAFDSKQAKEDILSMYDILKSIENITKTFILNFQEAKKDKNIIDFNDIEHLALKLLVEEDIKGNFIPTNVAKQYQDKFTEIAIDEYQDINLVQEQILTAVSNNHNMFMVGDIKQSIYKFRHARPELFKDKYETYGENRIQLYENFRSKKEILDLSNEIFKNIMTKDLGDVQYDEDEFLKQGIEYPKLENQGKIFGKPELHIIDLKLPEDTEEEQVILESAEVEAKFVANKIKEILEDDYYVYDKKAGYRKATFKDFVILLRTTTNVAPIYEMELNKLNYPVFTDNKSNYFETPEIQIILSLLKIIDNPNNDIPLVTVLRSPIGGFNDNELIAIKNNNRTSFYENLISLEEPEEGLKNKVSDFLDMLKDFKEKQEYLSLDELIWYIYEKTGFYNYVSLMKNAKTKIANLKMLFEKAKDYENGSFKGLYNFINFIDRLSKTSSDMGAPKLLGENDNVIRIMSIHKSKGLEFPIVFLSGTGKQFNLMDLNEKLLLHQDLGIGMQYIDYERKIEYSTLAKEAIKKKMKNEILSEEMRLLYVALTRSREKLIITGTEKDLQKAINNKKDLIKLNDSKNNKIDKILLKKAKTYLDWLEMIDEHDKHFKETIDIIYHSQEKKEEKKKAIKETINLSSIPEIKVSEEVNQLLNFEYKYKLLTQIEGKSSVSKIVAENSEIKETLRTESLKKPSFLKEQKLSKSEIGSAMHLVLQKLDFKSDYSIVSIKKLLEELQSKEILTEEEKNAVDINKIFAFTKTELFSRIKNAKSVYKEQPFYINKPINELYETSLDENVLVQGIIDLYFVDKNDKIVLVDYKTDYVKHNRRELVKKHRPQLMIYKEALEKSLNQKVDEVYIYSTYLGEAVSII